MKINNGYLFFLIFTFATSANVNAQSFWNPTYSWHHYWEDSYLTISLFDEVNGTINLYIAFESTNNINSTDFTVGIEGNPSLADILIIEDDWGAYPFGGTEQTAGAARPKNTTGDWCVSLTPAPSFNSNCATTPASKHAAGGKIYINT